MRKNYFIWLFLFLLLIFLLWEIIFRIVISIFLILIRFWYISIPSILFIFIILKLRNRFKAKRIKFSKEEKVIEIKDYKIK